MRKMEILSIRREYIDEQRRTIFIPKAKAGRVNNPSQSTLPNSSPGMSPPSRRARYQDTRWTFVNPSGVPLKLLG